MPALDNSLRPSLLAFSRKTGCQWAIRNAVKPRSTASPSPTDWQDWDKIDKLSSSWLSVFSLPNDYLSFSGAYTHIHIHFNTLTYLSYIPSYSSAFSGDTATNCNANTLEMPTAFFLALWQVLVTWTCWLYLCIYVHIGGLCIKWKIRKHLPWNFTYVAGSETLGES